MKPPNSTTNLTVKITKETARKARVIAAERDTSVSALVTSLIEDLARQRDGYDDAKKRALARMRKGYHLGFKPVPREQLHERG